MTARESSRGELLPHDGAEPLARFAYPDRLSVVRGGNCGQTITDTGGFGRSVAGEEAPQMGFDDADRAAVEQDVVRLSIETAHPSVAVDAHCVPRQRLFDNARSPLVGQRRTFVIAAHPHDVIDVQSRYEVRVSVAVGRRLQNTRERG